ncbi:amidohydrolase family protein [Allokutzneria sp. A3M-2-11 16]|uniref:amidohydrolase family protein n=1 Tax=Allokutzneria sp. A3M-2-11 16 TaxID=2962043 RepID=UPI0020B65901|nr:amidohydrolase family protein [Allokutzneria sp. A3M-2-11 16]MCP3800819.1 amidohydrolase family protein [Allokutzneria sp. A3M-2-11 16]
MSIVIAGARVFTGDRVLPEADVLVENGLVREVGTALRGAERVDGRGRTLLPGLIDAHGHVFTTTELRHTLGFGVTTVLDMLGNPGQVAELRAAAASDPGIADLRSAGTGATVPGGYPWFLVDMGYLTPFPTITEPDEAPGFIADRVREGSDHIKILLEDGTTTGQALPALSVDTAAALVDSAHQHGKLAVAHALTVETTHAALSAGVDVLAHVYLDRTDAELPYRIAERGTPVIPTLVAVQGLFGRPKARQLLDDPRVEPYLDDTSRYLLNADPVPLGPAARHDLDGATQTVAELREAGATILAGSDTSNLFVAHGASLHVELELLVAAGLSPLEALTSATSAPADCFGLGDRGRIAPGLRADLLLVEGDPTKAIGATLDIVAVWRGGRRAQRNSGGTLGSTSSGGPLSLHSIASDPV